MTFYVNISHNTICKEAAMKKITLVLFTVCIFTASISAERIELNNGEIIHGKIEVEETDHIVVALKNGTFEKISRDKIKEITPEEVKISDAPEKAESFLKAIDFHDMAVYGTLGYKKIQLDDLNSNLTAKGYQALPEDFYWREGKNSTLSNANTYRGSFNAASMAGTMGFLLLDEKFFQVIPYGGLGLTGMNLTLTNTTVSSFDTVTAAPASGVTLTSLAGLLKVGVQFNLKWELFNYKGGKFGLLTGIKTGYGFSFLNSDWAMGGLNDRVAVTGGPSSSLNGFYAQGFLGAWGTI